MFIQPQKDNGLTCQTRFQAKSGKELNVAPFGTPEGITVSSTVKNNDTDLLIVEKRINDSLKPLLLMSSMLSSDRSNVDVELISYLAQSAIVLVVNAQASLSRVRRNNIAKEIYGSEVLLPIKIKDTPKMFDETESERVRKLAKSIRENNEAKQSLLKLNYHSKSNTKKSVNSSGNNTTGNSSNTPRIFTMLLRPVLRMLRDINVSVIAYLDDLLIVGSTKEECLSNLKKTMDLLVKLGFKLNLEKSILEPTQSITFLGLQIDSVSMKLLVPKEKKKSVIKEIRNFLKLDCCSPRKLAGLKGKLIALKDAVIPFRLYTRRTNKFHSQCLTLANGDWDQSFPIPQDVKSEISHWLTVLDQWNGKEISLFPSYDYVLTTDASESGAGATLKKGNKTIKTWSF
ncbi:hypothetical protein ACTFIR_007503 [Dictyostelium discoideum]